jgi:hypothetical protein
MYIHVPTLGTYQHIPAHLDMVGQVTGATQLVQSMYVQVRTLFYWKKIAR